MADPEASADAAPAYRQRMSTLLRPMLTALALAAALYAAMLGLLWFGQERLIFLPTPLPATHTLARDPDVRERFVAVEGATLSVLELRLPDPKGVVFFLHGNAGNLASWFGNADFYRRAGYDLVMPDYRGYGKSSGRIESEAQLHADVRAVWREVAPRYAGRRVVLYGRSLGTALAATLAAELQPDLTLLVSPYASMVAMAREHYPWVPEALLRYPLRTDQQIGRIRTPVLLLHGDRDELIPLAHSQALRERAPQVRLHVVPGGGHNDLQEFESYLGAVRSALAAL
jgi:pimeloyl-ACP methyl ester carboxylesterase